jgi:cbb3-type cytochrome oxidase subunit 3
MKPGFQFLRPLIGIFILINSVVLLSKSWITAKGIDSSVLLTANILFVFLAVGAFLFQRKAMKNPNPNVFVRVVMGTMMMRMFFVAIVVIAYTLLSGTAFNKPAVFISLLLYLVYLGAEVAAVIKLNKTKNG